MGMEPIDRKNATEWAIAPAFGVGMIVGYSAFFLVNRETGREHQLHIPNGGMSFAFSASAGSPSYKLFTTKRPVNFADFDGAGSRITSANIGVFFGYSIVYLSLWEGAAYLGKKLAYVKMTGTGAMLPGGSWAHGFAKVAYGSGARAGTVPLVLNIDMDYPREPRMTRVQSKGREPPKLVVPDDVLFDFDRHHIKPSARRTLLEIADMLNNREGDPVVIEGYTDSVGSEEYNKQLSLRRALAVKQWFMSHRVYGAHGFQVRGYGEADPVAPNRRPDGSDNPAGRRQNRRVEVKFKGQIPAL